MGKLFLPEKYLEYPDFQDFTQRAQSLCFEECAQFLLFAGRIMRGYGQDCFFRLWKEGVLLEVVRRMLATVDQFAFVEERPVNAKPARIRLVLGDICQAQTDAIVNPTDETLSGSGGADRQIQTQGGPGMRNACRGIGKLAVGRTIRTAGYELKARQVIHVAVPKRDRENARFLLACCYANALRMAHVGGAKTLATTALGSGSSGFSQEEAMGIGARTLWNWCRSNPGKLEQVQMVFTDPGKLERFRDALLGFLAEQMRQALGQEPLAVRGGYSLEFLLKEAGGMVKLPDHEKLHADAQREEFFAVHNDYCDLVMRMYEIIDRPNYDAILKNAALRLGLPQGDLTALAQRMQKLDSRECVSFLLLFYRMDYFSGGTGNDHIKACMGGTAERLMERLIRLGSI
jgi:O-acetyl-ADP-ribose deacetylase (regulator of RNase III)